MRRLPSRVHQLTQARERYGDLIDRLAPWFYRTDPLADAVVEEFERAPARWALLDRAIQHGISAVSDASEPLCALFEALDQVRPGS